MIDPVIFWDFRLSSMRLQRSVAIVENVPVCRRCRWMLRRRRRLGIWICEHWRPWNFWKHDVVRIPRAYGPPM